MSGNIDPIWARKGNIGLSAAALAAANTALDGTGTVTTVFSADGTNGSFVHRLRFKAAGTNVQTVARIFLNNGGSNNTASNNVLFDEVTLPATTASNTITTPTIEVPLNIVLPPGWKINLAIGTAVAAGWYASTLGGDY